MTFSFKGFWRSSYSYWLSTLLVGFTLDPTEQLFHPLKTPKQAISENGHITGLAVHREGQYQANVSVDLKFSESWGFATKSQIMLSSF